jgi:hypothetical protein
MPRNARSPNPRDGNLEEYIPLDENQKQSKAVVGQAEVAHYVKKIQDWIDWDIEYADSLLICDLPWSTVETLSNILEVIKTCHRDEDMIDGESDDPPSVPDIPARSGLSKENEDLAETVRNMSRTNVILAEENRILKAQINHTPIPQTPSPADAGLEGSIHAPAPSNTFTKSANPVPITPSRKKGAPAKNTIQPRAQPTSPTQCHHKSRLIIHFEPHIEQETLRPQGRIVHEINEALRNLTPQVPENVRVKGMIISGASGTPIIIAGDGCTAIDLEVHKELIISIVAGDTHFTKARANADRQRFEVCLDNVPLRSYLGIEQTETIIETVVATASGLRGEMRLATPPRFMISEEDRLLKTRAPVRLSFHDEDQAKVLLALKTFFLDGVMCTIRPYIDRKPVAYCSSCSSLNHRENSKACKGPSCMQCASTSHTTDDHPETTTPKCINCAGSHGARSRECPARRQKGGSTSGESTDQYPRVNAKNTQKAKRTKKTTKDTEGHAQALPPQPTDTRARHEGPIYQLDPDRLAHRDRAARTRPQEQPGDPAQAPSTPPAPLQDIRQTDTQMTDI